MRLSEQLFQPIKVVSLRAPPQGFQYRFRIFIYANDILKPVPWPIVRVISLDVFKRDIDFSNVYVLAMFLPWEGRGGLIFYVSMKVAMALNCLWFWFEDWRDYEVFVSWFLLELIFFRRLILLEFRRFVNFSYSEVFCSFAFSWRK